MQSYRDLEIYKTAHRLALEIHKLTLGLPKFELYEEGSQIRRASKAVPANIVEGFCRKRYQQEYLRFLIFAHGSCNETLEHLELLKDTGALKDAQSFEQIKASYESLGKKLNRLIQVISEGINGPRLKAQGPKQAVP
jgi:four helix bundle protein